MARPRKKRRTQAPGQTDGLANGNSRSDAADRIPKSMVIRMGASDVGPSITQLVKDMRSVMEPHTASRLKERRSNRLRDYTTMAGPLGVSHLLLFSKSPSGNTNLRLAITPRGPTLTFRVERYSLCKDVMKSQRHPKPMGGGVEHLTPPLLVMNNFTSSPSNPDNPTTIPKHLESLTTSIFQSLFPAISPQRTPLSSIRRVLLLDRDVSRSEDSTYTLSFRHYAITSKPLVSISRGLKRLRTAEHHTTTRTRNGQEPKTASVSTRRVPGALPNMASLDDVADYLLNPADAGFTSASETEMDTDAEVEVLETSARKVLDRRELQQRRKEAAAAKGEGSEGQAARPRQRQPAAAQKRAIKLTELGPRLKLRLVKLEEGVCTGKVMWHEFVQKTRAEEKELDHVWEARRAEREERRRQQKENLEKKKTAAGGKRGRGDDAKEDEELVDMYADDDDDDEWDEYEGEAREGEAEVEQEDEEDEGDEGDEDDA